MKICILGCGLRTPLLLHGLVHSGLDLHEVVLHDTDGSRAQLMSELGRSISVGTPIQINPAREPEHAVEGSDFLISSFRVGGMETRARDERIALECGFAGQETTGPVGFAMALRTIPIALTYAKMAERLAPSAWIINFTNPAGIITQALCAYTTVRAVGICDTPAELIFQIGRALGQPHADVHCEYFGLNHLGWVRSVRVNGKEVIDQLIDDDGMLRRLYASELFPPSLIRGLRLIPTEYLFFYYNQTLARDNQRKVGSTRGVELEQLNRQIWADLEYYVTAGATDTALTAYRRYLNVRNSSYMRLEGAAESAFDGPEVAWDPFEGETGYHRIAVDALKALTSAGPHDLILNVPNRGAIEGMKAEDVVEVRCLVDRSGPRPLAVGPLPESVRGLVTSVKQFERLTIKAALDEQFDSAVFALSANPIVGGWDAAARFLERLAEADQRHFVNFHK